MVNKDMQRHKYDVYNRNLKLPCYNMYGNNPNCQQYRSSNRDQYCSSCIAYISQNRL